MTPYLARHRYPVDQDSVPIITGGGDGYPIREDEIVLVLGDVENVPDHFIVATLMRSRGGTRIGQILMIPAMRLYKLSKADAKASLTGMR